MDAAVATLTKSVDVVARKMGDECVIVPIRQRAGDLRCIYTMDGVASLIWDLVDGTRTIDEIVHAVVAEHEVSFEQAREDAMDFATSLVEAGCASWVSPESE